MHSHRVVLAMSGGVDSSVAAHLLVRAGHEVIGVFMRHGAADEQAGESGECRVETSHGGLPIVELRQHKQGCCSAADAEDARRVAADLDIPFYPLNLQDGFQRIVDYFVDEYLDGRTPNPCVMCNNWLKFGRLFDYADQIGAEYVATGHYARLLVDEHAASDDRAPRLLRGIDRGKDQSYVLFGVQRQRLRRMLLPVGGYRKEAIRGLARDVGLSVAAKPDSQEICFVASGDHAEFVARRRGDRATAGRLITTQGQVVGTHDGVERFTVGQRRGLGVALGERYYVVGIDAATSDVVLGQRAELLCRGLEAGGVNWLVEPPSGPRRCLVQIRYRAVAQPAVVTPLGDEGAWRVEFDEPCAGVAPGQAAVWYDGDQVLGGGWIERSLR